MIFAHTEDDLLLRDGARDYLRAQCTAESLRKRVESNSSDLPLWRGIAEQGLLGFLVSEDNGGLQLDADGFALIAEEIGYVCLPEPMTDVAAVVLPTLEALGLADLCSDILAGNKRIHPLHALHPHLNHLASEDWVLCFEEQRLSLISPADLVMQPLESIDPLRRISSAELPPDNIGETLAVGDQAADLQARAARYGAVMTAAELLGLAAAMIDMATAYAKDRQQFGKPIGSYQAVKHHLATALVALEFAKPVVYRAAHTLTPYDLADDLANDLAVAHAKIAASDAAINAAEAAIQVHGGMGYTFEVDLHMWMKRSWALTGVWGDRNYHMNCVDRTLFEHSKALGPSASFA